MFAQVLKLIKILNSEASPAQISSAVALAMFTGFGPLLSPQGLLIFLLVCLIRVNLSAFILATAGFSILAFVIDPALIMLGELLLGLEGLNGIWTALYQLEWMRLTRFNHTLVMGSFAAAALMAVPVFFLSQFIIHQYRGRIMVFVNNLRLVKLFKASDLFQRYTDLGA
ncbi:MAG: DUF2062 domain-containing protein [Oleiphilus sp.]|nr:MAG: DUF2062 domain-containing protein [Oleiphilus sp.]